MKRDEKRTCSATTSAGKPCRAVAVTAEGLCAAHGGLVDMQAIGKQGGLRRGKTPTLDGWELDADGVPVDLERWEDWRLYELSKQDKNQAAAIAALKERLARRQGPHGHDYRAELENAREQLEARLNRIEDHRRRAGQVCPTCGALLQVERADGREGSPSHTRC